MPAATERNEFRGTQPGVWRPFEEFDRSFASISQPASTRAGRDLRRDLGSKKISQSALKAYFGRCPALRLQSALEVLNANLMLNPGMPDSNEIVVWPRPMSSTQSFSRDTRSPCATMLRTVKSAVTSTVCTHPRISVQQTLQVGMSIKHERIIFVFFFAALGVPNTRTLHCEHALGGERANFACFETDKLI